MSADLILDAHQVRKSYGTNLVLAGIDLTVERGEVVCLLGPSGSGKSTFLRCINLLEKPDSGSIRVDGDLIGYELKGDKLFELSEQQLVEQRAKTGMVFQSFNLFGHLSVLQNITLAPQLTGRSNKQQGRRHAHELLERVGLVDKINAYPSQLSGGQQQRVAIARALAMEPELMLFDEPTSALDPELVGEVLAVIKDLAEGGTSMMIVTHEISFARSVADRVVFMADGHIVEQGPPAQVLDAPRNPRTIKFLNEI